MSNNYHYRFHSQHCYNHQNGTENLNDQYACNNYKRDYMDNSSYISDRSYDIEGDTNHYPRRGKRQVSNAEYGKRRMRSATRFQDVYYNPTVMDIRETPFHNFRHKRNPNTFIHHDKSHNFKNPKCIPPPNYMHAYQNNIQDYYNNHKLSNGYRGPQNYQDNFQDNRDLELDSGSQVDLEEVTEVPPDVTLNDIPPTKTEENITLRQRSFFQNSICFRCNKTVYLTERIIADQFVFHRNCLKCANCNSILTSSTWNRVQNTFFCNQCNKRWISNYLSRRFS